MSASQSAIAFQEFLTSIPPGGELRPIAEPARREGLSAIGATWELPLPRVIRLHCASDECDGEMNFSPLFASEANLTFRTAAKGGGSDLFITYRCKHCGRTLKTFSLSIHVSEDGNVRISKYGERPGFGRPLPRSLLRLFDEERQLLLSGRQCENQGLGLGAMAYYRRVIERQKVALFDALIDAAQREGADAQLVEELTQARRLRRFQESVESIHAAWPQSLLLDGQDPLSLLYAPLSVGVHELSEEECCSVATDFRIVLVAIAERLAKLREDRTEIDQAIRRLVARRGGAGPPPVA